MRFALFQADLEPLSSDAVARALAAVPRLAALDPARVAKDACGVLLDGLSREEAEAARDALGDARAQIGEQVWLEPVARSVIRRLRLEPDALVVLDAYGAATRVPWGDVLLLAAAELPLEAAPGTEARRERPTDLAAAVLAQDEAASCAPVLELAVRGPVRRHRIEAGSFDYGCLGERKQAATAQNFRALAFALAEHANAALHSPGMAALLTEGRAPRYDDARFERETAFLLWKLHAGDLARFERAPQPAAMPAALDPALLLAAPKARLGRERRGPRVARALWSLTALAIIAWMLYELNRMASLMIAPPP